MSKSDRGDQPIIEWLRAHEIATSTDAEAARAEWDPRTGTWLGSRPEPVRKRRSRPGARAALAGGVAGAVVAAALAVPIALAVRSRSPVEQRIISRVPAGRAEPSSIVDIAARARPWVVNIDVGTTQSSPFGALQVQGTGSGIILRSDGHVLTNAHVVQGATNIEVTLASGDKLPAKLVGIDPDTDIAVVKVNRTGLPAAEIGSVKDVRVGDTAIAIGSPLGLQQSVTAGIISALGRLVERPAGQPPLFDMVQTDAPVTQGNSGGALVDGAGAVIGVNAAIAASPEVGAEGVAFAIPVDIAVAVAEELINSGHATHPWLGVEGSNIEPEVAKEFGVEEGAFIERVVKGGPAERAGLRAKDIVVSFGKDKIESMDDLIVAIREHEIGERVQMTVVRAGKRTTLAATLVDKPPTTG